MRSRSELGVIGVAADVSTEEGRAAIVAEVRRLGRLDWLVNNAGAGGGTAGLDVDVERARRVLETNFYSHVALTHELWPLLCDSPRARVIVGLVVARHLLLVGLDHLRRVEGGAHLVGPRARGRGATAGDRGHASSIPAPS